jgi:hypothetical protein
MATSSAQDPPTYIDVNAFRSPAPFTFGNTPRTLAHELRNPRLVQSGPERAPRLSHRAVRLGVGFDVFNLFNTVVFGGIQNNITNANFGRVSSQTNTPRVGQIKIRLEF